MSGFLGVTQWVEQLLAAAPAVAPDIERSRSKSVERGVDAAVRIYPVNADAQAVAVRGGFHRWAMDVAVDCYARGALEGSAAGDAEAAADVLLASVWQRLAAAAPPPGVGSVLERPRIAWEFVEGDAALACARIVFGVGLSTHNQTLDAWS